MFIQNEIIVVPHLMICEFIFCNVEKIAFFSASSCCLLQFEACIIDFFHTYFFDFVLDVLIVTYLPRVYLIETKVKLTSYLFFVVNQLLFCN